MVFLTHQLTIYLKCSGNVQSVWDDRLLLLLYYYYYYYYHYYYFYFYYHLILFQIFFFFQWFYYKNERETNDDTYELRSNFKEKTEWEYQRNRNFVFGISSATILCSPLPHPFLGNCEMAVASVPKKEEGFFCHFLWLFFLSGIVK